MFLCKFFVFFLFCFESLDGFIWVRMKFIHRLKLVEIGEEGVQLLDLACPELAARQNLSFTELFANCWLIPLDRDRLPGDLGCLALGTTQWLSTHLRGGSLVLIDHPVLSRPLDL